MSEFTQHCLYCFKEIELFYIYYINLEFSKGNFNPKEPIIKMDKFDGPVTEKEKKEWEDIKSFKPNYYKILKNKKLWK